METKNRRLIALTFATTSTFGVLAGSACSSGDEGKNAGGDAATNGGAGPGSGGGGGIVPGGGGVSPSAGGTAQGGRPPGGGGSSNGGSPPNAGGTAPNAGGTPPGTGGADAGAGGAGAGGTPQTGCRAPVLNQSPGIPCRGTPPPALQLTPVVTSGLVRPTLLTHAPGDAERLFVLEQDGRIRVIRNGTLEGAPYLDITAVVGGRGPANEQGLLGLAFHPGYAQNGRFFVNYTDGASQHVLAEYHATPGQAADPGVVRILTTDAHSSFLGNHNGGMLAFSPADGCLYMSLGDGGDGDDPGNRGQMPQDPLGSMLRYDVDAHPTPAPGNMTTGGADPRTWAYGLRNPWRFSFDRATGDLYIGDVGQGAWEEIDVEPAGAGHRNYGWKVMEGMHCRPGGPGSCDESGLTLPAAEQENGSTPNQAIIGGYVYRGSRIPGMVGRYIYGDHSSRRIWTFTYAGETNGQPDVCDTADLSISPSSGITSFGEDAAGELYVVTLDGDVYRIDPG